MGDHEITDNALALLACARTKARINLRNLAGAVGDYVSQPDNRQLEVLRKAKQDLEIKWEAYEKAHYRVLSSASKQQLLRDGLEVSLNKDFELQLRDLEIAYGVFKDAVHQIRQQDLVCRQQEARQDEQLRP